MGSSKNKFIILGIVTLVLFVCMLYLEYFIQTTYKKQTGYVAKIDIPAGTTITAENIDTYVKQEEIPQDCVSPYTVSDPKTLVNKLSRIKIGTNDIITSEQWIDKNAEALQLAEPIEYSIMLEQDKLVAGTLRAGDKIDIHYVDLTSKKDITSLRGVYIDRVYDADGLPIENENKDAKAHTIVVTVDKKDVANIAQANVSGDMYVVRSLEDTIANNDMVQSATKVPDGADHTIGDEESDNGVDEEDEDSEE